MMFKDEIQRRPFVAHFVSILVLLNRRASWTSLAFLILLCALEEILIYHIGLLSAQFYYILLLKDANKLYLQLVLTLALIIFMALIKSAKNYVSSVLYIEWREHVSKRLIGRYFENLNYYVLNQSNGLKASLEANFSIKTSVTLDNIDQRITQDVDKLCAELSTVIPQIVLSPLTILYYSFKVYHGMGLLGLLACISVFLASTSVNRFFVKSIVKWTYLKGKHEGDYRNEHNEIVKSGEMIAFANAEAQQKAKTLSLLKVALSVHENLILSQFYLDQCTTLFNYAGGMLPFMIIAVPIFNGSFDYLSKAELSHKISASAFIILYLINCFSKIIDISSSFGTINGFGYRVTELLSTLTQASKTSPLNATLCLEKLLTEPVKPKDHSLYLKLDQVTVMPLFAETQTITNLCFEVRAQESLLITGDSEVDKTAIARIIKGLWPVASGTVCCQLDVNDISQVMFVSHNSRFAHYFLQDIGQNVELRRFLEQYLAKYSLHYLIDNDKSKVNTDALDNLSTGQMQIVNFGFVFYFLPRLLVLDDATNSLDEQTTDRLYGECAQRAITVLTIASNNNLAKFHSRFIRLNDV